MGVVKERLDKLYLLKKKLKKNHACMFFPILIFPPKVASAPFGV